MPIEVFKENKKCEYCRKNIFKGEIGFIDYGVEPTGYYCLECGL